MAINTGGNFQFKLNDSPMTLSPARAAAYAEALKLKAEVEAAQGLAGESVSIGSSREFARMQRPEPGSVTLAALSTGTNGEISGFVKSDAGPGTQYRLSQQIASSLVGGMLGGVLGQKNLELYTRTRVDADGTSQTQSLAVDRQAGLMNYSEFSLAPSPGQPPTLEKAGPTSFESLYPTTGSRPQHEGPSLNPVGKLTGLASNVATTLKQIRENHPDLTIYPPEPQPGDDRVIMDMRYLLQGEDRDNKELHLHLDKQRAKTFQYWYDR